MRALVQRVSSARVEVAGTTTGEVGRGLLVLVGAARHDTLDDVAWLARKVVGLRIFEDEAGRMQHDVRAAGGGILVVSQFTLYGDCTRGRRPSFGEAMAPDAAAALVDAFVLALRQEGATVSTGRFGATMQVHLVNEGPVTLMIESPARAQTM